VSEIVACQVDDVKSGSAIRVDKDGYRLAVVRIGDDWYALADRCSHAEASLSEGEVWPDECEIECPKHGSAFSLKTGEALTLPATQPVAAYQVRIDGDNVLVRIS
jgi:3-phenylpropionate/trans-cinnamate dioxygenase ferredoxin subunit